MNKLDFRADEAWTGTYTYNGITYDNYRVTYCTRPVAGLNWNKELSDTFFQMNIKVPSGLSEEQKKKAQILYYNPWGGDYGHPVPKAETLDNPMKEAVMKAGWILMEPGMRGTNCYTGTVGEKDFYHYGKLPRPLADLKAGIRYLRYGENVHTIPGNKDRIWIAGVSSGGCASSIIGTSSDAELFAPYLEEIGAADTSDAVYGSAPSCPVMNRGNLDAALAWERWYGQDLSDADEMNKGLVEYYTQYFNTLGLRAEKDVPEAGIRKGDLLTAENMNAYDWSYVQEAAVKFFGKMTTEEVQVYLQTKKPADRMYGTPETDRDWMKLIQDTNGNVIRLDGSYEDFWKYTVGAERYDMRNRVNMQCDRALSGPQEIYEHDGILNGKAGYGFGAAWGEPSTPSFGKPEEIGAIFTEFGQKWLEEKRNIPISDAYKELIGMQRNSVNPLYFILERKEETKIAEKWFLRTGTVDQVTPHPNFIGLGTALLNAGADADLAFVWDQTHGLTREIEEFLQYAEKE